MKTEKYINEEGFFVGDWSAEDAMNHFSNPDNQVKILVINKAFEHLDWIRHLTEVEELSFGHWKDCTFDGSDIILDMGLLPHNPNRSIFKITFECTFKSVLNWHKTDATHLNFGELWLGKDAYEHGFVDNPEEPWGERVQSILIYKQRATIKLQYFQDQSLKYYHDEQFYYNRTNLDLDFFGSGGEVFKWLEEQYTQQPDLAFSAKEIEIVGDGWYNLFHESNRIFTMLKTTSLNIFSESDEQFLELEHSGDIAIQQFVETLPSWPCKFHFGNLELGPTELPKIYAAFKSKGHTLNRH